MREHWACVTCGAPFVRKAALSKTTMSNANDTNLCPDCGKPEPHFCNEDDVYVYAREKLHTEAENAKVADREIDYTVSAYDGDISDLEAAKLIIDRQAKEIAEKGEYIEGLVRSVK